MPNPYFRNSTLDQNSREHELYRSGTNEIVQMYGREFAYIPKTLVKPDYIFGEDVLKQFNSYKPITLLIENFSEYSGQGDIFSKFGLTIDDRLDLISERQTFKDIVGTEPQIGDLIYDHVSNRIFKINHVKYDDSFNQLTGENMTYKMSCILLKYSHEGMNTGITNVDSIEDQTDSNTQTELTSYTTSASEIIDFSEDFFEQQ